MDFRLCDDGFGLGSTMRESTGKALCGDVPRGTVSAEGKNLHSEQRTLDLIKGKGMEGKRKEYGPVSRGQPLKKSPGAMKTKVRCQIWVPLCAAWLQQGRLGMEHQNGCYLFTCSLIRSRVASTDLPLCTKDDFGLLMVLPLYLSSAG